MGERMKQNESLAELWGLVKRIPKGRVASYGEIGRALKYPASGFQVGRWMARCPDGIPWWRVVGKTGTLPINKRDPSLSSEQEQRLLQEGATILDGIVAQKCFWSDW